MAQLQSTSITGSLIVTQGITGSFSGSISNATSASYAATASYALNAGDSVWTGSAGNIYYNGGNVGIGTVSPTSKLTIYDTTQNNTTYSASLSVQNFGGVDDNNRIQIAGVFHSSVSPSANVYGFGVQGIGEKPGSYGHGVVGVQGVGKISGVNNSTGTLYAIGVEGLVYATGSNNTYYRANTTYGLRSTLIATPGSTIATHYGLYVAEGNRQGGSVITSSYAIVTEAGAGNVGIGTTNPSQKFVVSNGSSEVFKVYSTGEVVVDTNYIYAAYSSGTSFYAQGVASFRNGIHNDTSTYLKIDGGTSGFTYFSGNVGIGTTNPAAKLYVVGSSQNTLALDSPAYPELTFRVSGTVKSYDAIVTTNQGYFNTSTVGDRIYRTEAGNHLFGYSTTEIMRIASGGNVGIGTASPSDKLSVVGNVSVTSGDYRIYNGSTILSSTSTSLLEINAGGFSNVSITNGNVGIGTTTPSQKLVVNGRAIVGGGLTGDALSISTSIGTYTFNGYDLLTPSSFLITAGSSGYLSLDGYPVIFKVSGGERMRVNTDGNIGIGTTSTPAQLTLSKAAGNQMVQLINSTEAGFRLHIHNSGSGNTGEKVFTQYLGYNDAMNGYIAFHRGSGGSDGYLSFGDNGGERVRFAADGNVGIGSTAPTQKLDVNGYILSDRYYPRSSNGTYIYGDTGGLVVQGSGYFYVPASQGSYFENTVRFRGTIVNDASTYLTINGGTSGFTYFSGNVGIGVTNPSVKLHVDGTIKTGGNGSGYVEGYRTIWETPDSHRNIGSNAYQIENVTTQGLTIGYSSNQFMVVNTSGNVGIGTTGPAYKLDVVGVIRSNSSNVGTINLGTDSFSSSNTTSQVIGQTSPSYTSTGKLSFKVLTWGVGSDYGPTEQMYIDVTGPDTKAATLVMLPYGGNVGIGTTSPSNKLEVLGSATIRNSSGGGALNIGTNSGRTEYQYVTFGGGTGGTDYGWQVGRSPQTGGIINDGFYIYDIKTNNAPFAIALGGNVGIGTTSPGRTLTVKSSNIGIRMDNTSNTNAGLEYYVSTGTFYNWLVGAQYNLANTFEITPSTTVGGTTYSTPALVVNASGSVGIGTTNPGQKLDVNGTGIFRDVLYTVGNIYGFTPYYGNSFLVNNNGGDTYFNATGGNVGIGITNPVFSNGSGLVIYNGSASRMKLSNSYAGPGATDGFELIMAVNDAYVWNYEAGPMLFGTNSAERIRITSGGNIGIGTTNPVVKLQVDGTITSTGPLTAYTSVPSINIGHNGDSAFIASTSGGGANTPISFSVGNNAEKMRITSTGNVGIGTTNPGQKLVITTSGGSPSINIYDGTTDCYLGIATNAGGYANGTSAGDLVIRGSSGVSFSSNGGTSVALRLASTGAATFSSSVTAASFTGSFSGSVSAPGSTTQIVYNSGGVLTADSGLVYNGGNVGIGTASPASRLEVGNFLDAFTNSITVSGRYEYIPQFTFKLGQSGTNLDWTGGVISCGDDGNYNGIIYFKTANAGRDTPTTKMVIKASGNVGIGTITPSQKLETVGIIKSSGASNSLMFENRSAAGNTWEWYSQGSVGSSFAGLYKTYNTAGTVLAITDTGNVGIGTTSPNGKLHVVSPDSTYAFSVAGATKGVRFNINSNGTFIQGVDNTLASSYQSLILGGLDLYFQTNGVTNAMYINSSGNVGINTTSPDAIFHVAKAVSSGVGGQIVIDNPASSAVGNTAEISFLTDAGASGAGTRNARILAVNEDAGNGAANMQFHTWNGSASAERMRITAGGNIGIGITNPAAKLQVEGGQVRIGNAGSFTTLTSTQGLAFDNVASAYGIEFLAAVSGLGYGHRILDVDSGAGSGILKFQGRDNSSTWSDIMSLRLGNVGIGTTSPTEKLDVAGVGKFTGTNVNVRAIDGTIITKIQSQTVGGTQGAVGTESNNDLSILTNNTTRMLVTAAGNVGIGTTSPGYKLDVVGEARFGSNYKAIIGDDGTYGGYSTIGFGGTTNGYNRIFGRDGTADGLYLCSATGHDITFRPNGGTTDVFVVGANGYLYSNSYLFAYEDASYNRLYRPNGTIGIYLGGSGDPGNYYDNTNHNFRNSGGGTVYAVINSSGNLGIGTTSPSAALHIYKNQNEPFIVESPNANTWMNLVSTDGNWSMGAAAGNKWMLYQRGGVNQTRMTIDSSGNVGIGTISPTRKLHILSTDDTRGIMVEQSLASSYAEVHFKANREYRIGTGGSTSAAEAANNWYVYDATAAAQRFVINSAGSVGIGTTSPDTRLDLAGGILSMGALNSGTEIRLRTGFANNGSGGVGITPIDHNGGNADGLGLYGSDGMSMWTSQTERMRITSGGNVGIGTSSPGAKLEVAGNGIGKVLIGDIGGYTNYAGISLNGSAAAGSYNILSRASDSTLLLNRPFGDIAFWENNATLQMVIKGTSGNVGIGTASPSQILETYKSTNGDVAIQVTNPNAGASATAQFFASNGTTQTQFFHTGTSYNGTGILASSAGLGGIYNNTAQGIALLASSASGPIRFGTTTSNTERMRITDGGNVGIGVTAPAAKLQVSGSSNVLNVRGSGSAATSSIFSVDGNNGRLFEVSDDLSNSLFSVNTIAGLPVIEAFADYTVTMGTYGAYTLQVTGSRVGVGTSSPGYPLHVSGSVSGISIYATNDIAAFSDQSVKTDLQVIDSAVDRIKQINGYTYVRIDDLSNTRRAGVIAQEVQKVLPEVVSENQDGTLNVAYSNMIALLIEGMKEQQTQIDELKQRLDNL